MDDVIICGAGAGRGIDPSAFLGATRRNELKRLDREHEAVTIDITNDGGTAHGGGQSTHLKEGFDAIEISENLTVAYVRPGNGWADCGAGVIARPGFVRIGDAALHVLLRLHFGAQAAHGFGEHRFSGEDGAEIAAVIPATDAIQFKDDDPFPPKVTERPVGQGNAAHPIDAVSLWSVYRRRNVIAERYPVAAGADALGQIASFPLMRHALAPPRMNSAHHSQAKDDPAKDGERCDGEEAGHACASR